jgi:hypothetical protein
MSRGNRTIHVIKKGFGQPAFLRFDPLHDHSGVKQDLSCKTDAEYEKMIHHGFGNTQ